LCFVLLALGRRGGHNAGMLLSIEELLPRFPAIRIAAVVAEDLAIPGARPPELEALIAAREAACRAQWTGLELSAIPGIAAWRAAYKGFGIKSTSYRSSVERLVKNVLAGRTLPAINGFVDAYNAVSLAHVLPAGADDLAHVVGDVAFRFAREGDSFEDMSGDGELGGPPKPGEVVYADAAKVLCRRWNWRQDGRSVITPATRRALVTLQSNGVGDVAAAADDLCGLIGRFAGGRAQVAIANADQPVIPLD
jgi:DNA/RNA-binding domain of Phe-tRNA-synthetase-like protein